MEILFVIAGVIGSSQLLVGLLAVILIYFFIKKSKKRDTLILSSFEDLYNYDYPALLEKSTFFEKEVRPNGLIRYKYDVPLDKPFLDVLDMLRIDLCWPEKELKIERVDYGVNLIFFSKRKSLTNQQIVHVVDSIVWACRNDPNHDSVNKYDAIRFKEGSSKFMMAELLPSVDGNFGCTVGIKNNGSNEITVDLNILYKDLLQLRHEIKSH